MRLGLISDIHCNAAALHQALAAMAGTVEEIVVLGDIIHEYRFNAEVVGAVRDLGCRYIVGNHELAFLGAPGERARAAPSVAAADVAFLADAPTTLDVRLGPVRLRAFHASPWPPHRAYVRHGSRLLEQVDDLDADIVLLGHTHEPMVGRFGRTLVVNPGSLGESREDGARDLVSYAVLDTTTQAVEVIRFENPLFAAPPGTAPS